jgi:hypothetical protein
MMAESGGSSVSEETSLSTTTLDLLKLFTLSNVAIEPRAFEIIHDLIKNGVSADAIYAFLVTAMKESKLGKKLLKARSKARTSSHPKQSPGSQGSHSSRREGTSSSERRKSGLIESNQPPDQV